MEIPIELPLDTDGFLRRECPTCLRQFKWHHGRTMDAPVDYPEPSLYCCPLCGQSGGTDMWWTQEQVDYQEAITAAYAPIAAQEALKASMPTSTGFHLNWNDLSPDGLPGPLFELDDMEAVAPPCHPWEPIKVPSLDDRQLYCLVCGQGFGI